MAFYTVFDEIFSIAFIYMCRYQPTSCKLPICQDDPILCPERIICSPVPLEMFKPIDMICVTIFTVEYGVRLLTSWANDRLVHKSIFSSRLRVTLYPINMFKFWVSCATSNESEHVPYSNVANTPGAYLLASLHMTRFHFIFLLSCSVYFHDESDDSEDEFSVGKVHRPLYMNVFFFVIRIVNITDLLCILPYWIELGLNVQDIQGSSFLRVVRILRVFKIIRFSKKPQQFLELIAATMMRSTPALGVIALLLVLLIIFFGFIIYYCESGTFQITEDYPQGEYMRRANDGDGWEISPFQSVPTSIYFVVTTGTTGTRATYMNMNASLWELLK